MPDDIRNRREKATTFEDIPSLAKRIAFIALNEIEAATPEDADVRRELARQIAHLLIPGVFARLGT